MAIQLKEGVDINAPVDDVWRFLLSPEDLARCMPGAEVVEVADDGSFRGGVKMRVGAISVKYEGDVKYEVVDREQRRVVMRLQAGEGSGGTVSGRISTSLSPLSEDTTRAEVESSVDLTGRLVQVGRGMIDGVSRQVIGTFIRNVQIHFAVPQKPANGTEASEAASRTDRENVETEALNVSVFVRRAFVKWLSSAFDRLFRRSRGKG
jgi:hypothetical protein